MKDFEEIAKEQSAASQEQAIKKKPLYKRWWFWVILVFIVAEIYSAMFPEDVASKDTDDNSALSVCVDLKYQSMDIVEEYLKAPATAEFPDITEWEFRGEVGSDIYVLSYVDAQNIYGVPLREDFIILFKYFDGGYSPVMFGLGDNIVFDYSNTAD